MGSIIANKQIDPTATLNQALSIKQLLEDLNQAFEILPLASGSSLRCFCPIHKSNTFRTLLIDIDHRSFKCSYTQCPGNKEGKLIDLFALTFNCSKEAAFEFWGRRNDGVKLTLEDLKTIEKNLLEHPRTETPPLETKPEPSPQPVMQEPVAQQETTQPSKTHENQILDVEFMESLNKEMARSRRFHFSYSVVIVQLTENSGDSVSNQAKNCGVELFQYLIKLIRPYDTLTNYGTNKFSFLFPQVNREQTRLVVKRLKKMIQQFINDKYSEEFGLHYGFAHYDGSEEKITTDEIVAKALDDLLENIAMES